MQPQLEALTDPLDECVEYDRFGRMQYNTVYHPNHGKPFTESDLEYLCKYYERDGFKLMAMALGKTEKTVAQKVAELRKQGRFDYYKRLNKHW